MIFQISIGWFFSEVSMIFSNWSSIGGIYVAPFFKTRNTWKTLVKLNWEHPRLKAVGASPKNLSFPFSKSSPKKKKLPCKSAACHFISFPFLLPQTTSLAASRTAFRGVWAGMPSQIPTQVSPKADWISSKALLWDRKVRLTIRKARWQFLGMNGGHLQAENGKTKQIETIGFKDENTIISRNAGWLPKIVYIRFKWLSLQHFRTSCQQLILEKTISKHDIF